MYVIKSDKDITVENFKKMPYLDCVINEAMRFFSPVPGPFQQEFIEDTTIGGFLFKRELLSIVFG